MDYIKQRHTLDDPAMILSKFKPTTNWLWCVTALLSCTCQGCDTAQVEIDEAKKKSKTGLSSPLAATSDKDSTLFSVEFTLLNVQAGVDSAQVSSVLRDEPGVYSFNVDVATGVCQLKLDSIGRYRQIFQVLRAAGLEMEATFSMSGPGLTCDIEPTEHERAAPAQKIIVVDKSEQKLRQAFNDAADGVRVISIPNPACRACVNGQRLMDRIFTEEFSEAKALTGFVVWISINGWGSLSEAQLLARETNHTRWTHFWDAEMYAGKLFKAPINLNAEYLTAWDVYLIYAPGIHWVEDSPPPKPTFWMHQLSEDSGAEPRRRLDEKIFIDELRSLL